MVFKNPNMPKGRINHRFRARLAILLQKIFFKRTGIHAYADGTVIIFCRLDNFTDALGRADVAGIDAQTGRSRHRRFNSAFIMEVNIRHDRHRDLFNDFLQRFC